MAAQELAEQNKDNELKAQFAALAQKLESNEEAIVKEMNDVQDNPVDINGCYFFDKKLATKVMRPRLLFNDVIASL